MKDEAWATLVRFGAEGYSVSERLDGVGAAAAIEAAADEDTLWLNVIGLDAVLTAAVGHRFGLHPLLQEDVVSTGQRPKVELTGETLFLSIKSLSWDAAAEAVSQEQISLWLGPRFVVSWQESAPDLFAALYERLRLSRGRLRRPGTPYLGYVLVDILVDEYYAVVEGVDAALDRIEAEMIAAPAPALLGRLHGLRQTAAELRRAVWPLREMVSRLITQETRLVDAGLMPYWRDVYDHVVQIIEMVETLREWAAGLHDLYLSLVSQQTNEIMRVLTVIATLFIPLTFITSLYGMNFHHMPELAWRWGYVAVWLILGATAGGLLWFFRRRGWLGTP